MKQTSFDVTKIEIHVKDSVNKVKQHYHLRSESLQPVVHRGMYPGRRKYLCLCFKKGWTGYTTINRQICR